MDLEKLRIDRSKPRRRPPSGGGRWLKVVALALLVGAVAVFWRPITSAIDRVRLPTVRVARVDREHPAAVGAVEGMAANGYVVAARRAALSADTPGRIVEMRVQEGSVVQEGDVVARLYAEEYEAALRRAEADARAAAAAVERAQALLVAARVEVARSEAAEAAARSALRAAEAELALANQEMVRVEALVEQGVFTTRELDQARATLRRAEAEQARIASLLAVAVEAVAAARAQLGVSQADLGVLEAQTQAARAAQALAEATLAKTFVRAPFSGVVVLKDAEVGEVVSPNVMGGASTRGAVATLVDFASLEVQADVPETSLHAVAVGAPARVFLDAFPDQPYAGEVSRIWPTADRQKATVEVRVRLLEPDQRLRPEMGVRVVFLPEGAEAPAQGTEPAELALLVPEAALVRDKGRVNVFVLERDVVELRPLEIGPRRGGRVAVRSGLREGERVVLEPPPGLVNGDRVQLEEAK